MRGMPWAKKQTKQTYVAKDSDHISVLYIAAHAFLSVVLLYITVDFATAASQNGDGKTQQMRSVYNDPYGKRWK